jgi:hypothetical protein
MLHVSARVGLIDYAAAALFDITKVYTRQKQGRCSALNMPRAPTENFRSQNLLSCGMHTGAEGVSKLRTRLKHHLSRPADGAICAAPHYMRTIVSLEQCRFSKWKRY